MSYPSLSGWSVKGHFTVKSQAAVFFVRGGVRDATGSEGPLVLRTDARPVIPNMSLFQTFTLCHVDLFKLQFMQDSQKSWLLGNAALVS